MPDTDDSMDTYLNIPNDPIETIFDFYRENGVDCGLSEEELAEAQKNLVKEARILQITQKRIVPRRITRK